MVSLAEDEGAASRTMRLHEKELELGTVEWEKGVAFDYVPELVEAILAVPQSSALLRITFSVRFRITQDCLSIDICVPPPLSLPSTQPTPRPPRYPSSDWLPPHWILRSPPIGLR